MPVRSHVTSSLSLTYNTCGRNDYTCVHSSHHRHASQDQMSSSQDTPGEHGSYACLLAACLDVVYAHNSTLKMMID